jgi:hypothetical protein
VASDVSLEEFCVPLGAVPVRFYGHGSFLSRLAVSKRTHLSCLEAWDKKKGLIKEVA